MSRVNKRQLKMSERRTGLKMQIYANEYLTRCWWRVQRGGIRRRCTAGWEELPSTREHCVQIDADQPGRGCIRMLMVLSWAGGSLGDCQFFISSFYVFLSCLQWTCMAYKIENNKWLFKGRKMVEAVLRIKIKDCWKGRKPVGLLLLHKLIFKWQLWHV